MSCHENAVNRRLSAGKPRKSIFPQSPLRIPRPKPTLFHLKRGSEDHSYGRPQNLADAPWLENRSITILMLSRGASSAFQYLPSQHIFLRNVQAAQDFKRFQILRQHHARIATGWKFLVIEFSEPANREKLHLLERRLHLRIA